MLDLTKYPLEELAEKVGTPFFLYDAGHLRETLGRFAALVDGPRIAGRFAMKANSARVVLDAVREAGLWIDAGSGNEVARALRAGFPGGPNPPVILLTTDVFRDNAMNVVLESGVMPNVGSPGMVGDLAHAGYRGPIAVRVNPGFGHGHVQSCDTGGPSSKHGIWPDDLEAITRGAREAGLPIAALHAHVGTGPQFGEFDQNMRKLIGFFEALLPALPDVVGVNFGGGIPYAYHPGAPEYDLTSYREILTEAVRRFERAIERPIRVEIEPGRYLVAGMAALVCRVKDIKRTITNEKGPGHEFVMVDAGFCDLVRPAMYGSYHHIDIAGRGAGREPEPFVVAGPLCESGDVFTRDDRELLDPRPLPRPEPGDLLVLHDAGAYGAAMSSNYISMGRAAQVLWDDDSATLVARRETLDDLTRTECSVPL